MDAPRKILVPVDLSSRSESAVGYAALLATAFGAELVLVTNVSMHEREELENIAEAEAVSVEQAGELALRGIVEKLAPGVAMTSVLSHDDFPADGILRVAAAGSVDLIVIASHGRSGFSRWLLGSVAEKIARNTTVPVVIVPARDD